MTTWREAWHEGRRICAFDYVWKIGLVALGMTVMAVSLIVAHVALNTTNRLQWFMVGFIASGAVYSWFNLVRVVLDARERLANEAKLQGMADLFAFMIAEALRQQHGIEADVELDPKTHRIKVVPSRRTVH